MDFEKKVGSDYYKNKKPYASRLENPEVFMAYKEEGFKLYQDFKKDFKEYIDTLLGYVMSKNQFEAFFQYVWSQGHSGGYYEVVNCSYDLIEVIKKFIKKD